MFTEECSWPLLLWQTNVPHQRTNAAGNGWVGSCVVRPIHCQQVTEATRSVQFIVGEALRSAKDAGAGRKIELGLSDHDLT